LFEPKRGSKLQRTRFFSSSIFRTFLVVHRTHTVPPGAEIALFEILRNQKSVSYAPNFFDKDPWMYRIEYTRFSAPCGSRRVWGVLGSARLSRLLLRRRVCVHAATAASAAASAAAAAAAAPSSAHFKPHSPPSLSTVPPSSSSPTMPATSTGPKYSVLIAQAIAALKERSGSSVQAIVK